MKKVFLLIITASVCLLSCKKEPAAESETWSTITASVESSETKGDLISSDNYANSSFIWRSGDFIKLFFQSWKSDKNQEYYLSGGANTSSGTFTRVNPEYVDLTAATYAIYPSSGNWVYENDEQAHFSLPDAYSGYSSNLNLLPLVAQLDGSEHPNINFKYIGGAIIVPFIDLPGDAHSIGLTVEGKSVCGSYVVNPAGAGTAQIEASSGSNSTIWLNYGTTDSPRDFTFIFPVPVITGDPKLSFQIYNSSNIKIWTRTASKSTSVGRAQALVFDPITFDASEAYSISGFINGYDRTNVVRFKNNQATYTFENNSYVYISHIDDFREFWFPDYVATPPGEAFNEYGGSRPKEKMLVPAGNVTFTLTINDSNKVTLNYVKN